MKFLGPILSLSLASVACIGQVGNSSGDKATPPPGTETPPPPGMAPPNPAPIDVGTCNAGTLAKPRAWRLTHAQVKNSLRDSLGFAPPAVDGFPAESRIDVTQSRNGFSNRADTLKISPLLADSYFKASEELAAEVVSKADKYGVTCAMAQLGSGNCLKTFLGSFGLKMWRRPLTEAELTNFTSFYTTSAGLGEGPEGGLRNVVQAMFLSPNFLYRTEIGHNTNAGEVTYLTDYELASALSYALWDSSPDADLLDLASKGKLTDKTVLVAQAKRMLGSVAKTGPALHGFVEQWLHVDDLVTGPPKDQSVFSLATPQVAADLVEENRRFVDSVLLEGDKSFKTLFTAKYGFVNSRTAALYGIQGVTGDQMVKKDLPADQRRGILTQASFMWGHANPDGTHPVERGRYFREEILCEGVPDPGPNVIIDPQFGDETLTARERLAVHLKEPACAACHSLIDGLGLAMENYDGIGRFRTEEAVKGGPPKPIDSKGTVPLPSDEGKTVLSFNNLIDLVDQLATKPDVYSCFASQYLDYATGRRPGEIDKCEKAIVTQEFVKSDYNVDSLVLSVIGSPSFTARKN
jgi:hypothetical protein